MNKLILGLTLVLVVGVGLASAGICVGKPETEEGETTERPQGGASSSETEGAQQGENPKSRFGPTGFHWHEPPKGDWDKACRGQQTSSDCRKCCNEHWFPTYKFYEETKICDCYASELDNWTIEELKHFDDDHETSISS